MTTAPLRLSTLSHGEIGGSRLPPSFLRELLADKPAVPPFAQLLVGTEAGDGAAAWQIDERTCIIASMDFLVPMVDDPRDFGRIAAANALSDIYAMGGKPIMALTVLGMPLDKLPMETVRRSVEGGRSICSEAGIPIAGGHSVDSPEPYYGLVVVGLCTSAGVRHSSGAKPGDALILTKAVGVGIYAAAFRSGALAPAAYEEMIASATLLNAVGAKLAEDDDVHAMTSLAGSGLLGHGLEMARGAGLTLNIRLYRIPLLQDAAELAKRGFATGTSHRNWDIYGRDVVTPPDLPPWHRTLLADPQASGGLLIACAPHRADEIRQSIAASGCHRAEIIGSVSIGDPVIRLS